MGTLYLTSTPIGNLKDITLRSLEILQAVDGIICEDTRRTAILINHYQIHKPLLVLNDFNEAQKVPEIVQKLKTGENLALVSDAGTPLISDPGYKLVRTCLEENIPVDSLPGPSSFLSALTLSSLPPDKFTFLGYPPEKGGKRIELLRKLLTINQIVSSTYIFFVSPYKIIKTLEEMKEIFGNIEVVIAKELTKVHQSVKKQPLSSWVEQFKKQKPKGEYVLLFSLTSSLVF